MNLDAAFYAKRKARERRFEWYGKCALGFAMAVLVLLLGTIVVRGIGGFTTTTITLPITYDAKRLELATYGDLAHVPTGSYLRLAKDALAAKFPEATNPAQMRELMELVSPASSRTIRQYALENDALGKTIELEIPAASKVDMYLKGKTDALKEGQVRALEVLKPARGVNFGFFTHADSRLPEVAGFVGGMVGSLLAMLTCFLIAFPIGVAAAVYLEEFAPKNAFTRFVEINIANLAAVPSIIYGLLGLSVYINVMHLPRSAPLVGGLTLALMMLPVLIIATRASLSAVPQAIRQAALAMGATPLQVALHHTVPLAMPGIMTGTILGLSRAIGETAPLLMIGMVAFVADIPRAVTDPATVMPVQIYLWATSPESGFVEKTASGILVLIALLLLMNAAAIYLRKKFEVRW